MKGAYFYPEDAEEILLLELIISDEGMRSNWIGVTEEDVSHACYEYGLDFDEIMNLIRNKDRSVHTLFIDLPQYRKAREGNAQDHHPS